MTHTRKLLTALVCCAAVAWLAGPAGRMLVLFPLLLFGPGYLFEQAFRPLAPPHFFLHPVLWIGLSISIVVLLYTWVTALGLALSPLVLGILIALCGLGVAWHMWQAGTPGGATPSTPSTPAHTVPPLMTGALLAILGATLVTRFIQIRDLVLPNWVDSVHHALLIRVAAEQGQAPYSLRPYMPVDNLPYHWGYHVFMAPVLQLSGLDIPQTMLWSGQILNTLHALTCAALAAYFWRRPLAGVAAALVVGLISTMPAYYVSWGRYTQLTGLLILPPLVVCWHSWLHRPTRRFFIFTAVLLAGLSLVHVRVLVFALSLMAVIGIVWLVETGWAAAQTRLKAFAGLAVITGVLAGPWLVHLVMRELAPAVSAPQTLLGGGSYNALKETLLWTGQNRLLIALALVSAFWGLWRRSRSSIMFVGWLVILAVLANPWLAGYLLPFIGVLIGTWGIQQRQVLTGLIGGAFMLFNPVFVSFPYVWLITNEIVVISLFVPVSVLIGGGACLLADWLERLPRYQRAARATYAAALILAFAWGTWQARSIINSTTVFATSADLTALEWVREHTPHDARFLINVTNWFPDVYRGTDGGWWLMPLTGRWTSTPPVLYTRGEQDYVEQVRARSKQIASFEPGQEAHLYDLIQREGITHIYINNTYTNPEGEHVSPLITPQVFADHPAFEIVYQQDNITILAVKQ